MTVPSGAGQLARQVDCRYCHQPIFLAVCRDGRWRTFDLIDTPAHTSGVWAWRRHLGMEEQELVPGKRQHHCIERAHFLADQKLLREESRQPPPSPPSARTRPAF